MNLATRALTALLILFWLSQAAFAFTFALYGDNQGRYPIFKEIIKDINADPKIDFVISLGDCVGNGTDQEYRTYLGLTQGLKPKLYQVPGNHDLANGGWRNYLKYFDRYYYSFDHENSHFIVINNAFKDYFDAKQFNWLKADLAATRQENIFVCMHKPTFDPSAIYPDHVMSGSRVIKELMALFERYKVKYVFAGHIHGYARSDRDGVIYLVSAGAGAPLYLPRDFGGFHHYVKITVNGEKITEQVVRIDD